MRRASGLDVGEAGDETTGASTFGPIFTFRRLAGEW
jgi:hypothetical protein